MFRFSVFKMVPPAFRMLLYHKGDWLVNTLETRGNSGATLTMLDNYARLDYMPELTAVNDSAENYYNALVNSLTHEWCFFQAPDYAPATEITNFGSGPYHHLDSYHTNMAVIMRLAEWLEYLKAEGVYDNTRIIIAADHGWYLDDDVPDNFRLPNGTSMEQFHPLFLYKDFTTPETRRPVAIDNSFSSHADGPWLAAKDVTAAVNPFNGKPLNSYDKSKGFIICTHSLWQSTDRSKRVWDFPANEWLQVKNDIFIPSNWSMWKNE
jgi:membrane-anchored protein YejM (alkaline phosphatase superfamily)